MKLLIIDLMNLAFRSYHGFARQAYLNYNGKPTFMAYGVALAFNKLLAEYSPTHVAVAAEGGGKTFRHAMFPDYKAGRKERPDDFGIQLSDVYEMINAFGFKVLRVPGVEADDVVGSLCEKYPEAEILIFSGDKDFMQLVNDKVSIIRHSMEGYDLINAEGVERKFGCRPDQVADALAIAGDAADNIPGVRGIGEKGAAGLLAAYGTLDNIYANLENIKPNLANKLAKSQENAMLSQKLAKINKSVELSINIDELAIPENAAKSDAVNAFFAKLNFKSLVSTSQETLSDIEIDYDNLF